jgi:hypothetical protein
MSLDNEISRAQQASDVIDNPLYQEAFTLMRERLMQQWADSPARDTEGREKLWQMTKLLDGVEGHLKQIMETGKIARVQIEQESLLQRLKSMTGID